jgi:DNA mismatch repair protein MutL
MSRINILESCVYNQISAGEVVENPSSVVKELVENSIDAGADNIAIMIEDGGIKSISIIDNGCGIEKDDLPRTVLPHATSKILSAKDLLTIGTLGFRGEALASIAAISEVVIKSKFIEADNAFEYIVKGGEVQSEGITNLSIGTSITVNNIFYNTPARYKFLKSKKGEESLITKLVQDFIFSNPNISFKYYINNNLIYQTAGSGLEDAIYAVYSTEIADNMIPFSISEKGHTITGFTARPATAAIFSNKNRQNIIVNGRIIDDNTLAMVVQNAYGESLMKRTFPTIIIDIIMPFELVDVNVHPNKKEVRFANAKQVYGLVYNAVKNALEKDSEDRQTKLFESVYNLGENSQDKIASKPVEDKQSQYFTPTNNTLENFNYSSDMDAANYHYAAKIEKDKEAFAHNYNDEIQIKESVDPVKEFFANKENIIKPKVNYRVLGQLFDTYILIEYHDTILLIDQHAAHERILYDKLLSENEQKNVVQELLFPYTANVSEDKMSLILENIDVLHNLGFEVSANNGKIRLTAIPYLLINMDIDGFLSDIIEDAELFGKISDISFIKEKIAQKACKKAIKGGDKLDDTQLDYVINYFLEKGMPLQCPHGRPTIIKITKQEIEKLFRRIV